MLDKIRNFYVFKEFKWNRLLILMIFTTTITQLCSLSIPKLTSLCLDINNEHFSTILIVFLAVIVIRFGFNILDTYASTCHFNKMNVELKDRVFNKMMSLDINYYGGTDAGTMSTLVLGDVADVCIGYDRFIAGILSIVIDVIFTSIMLLNMNLVLAEFILTSFVISMFLLKRIYAVQAKLHDQRRESKRNLRLTVSDAVNCFELFKNANQEDFIIRKFSNTNRAHSKCDIKCNTTNSLLMSIVNSIGDLDTLGVIIIGIYFARKGAMTIPDVVAFIMLSKTLYNDIKMITNFIGDINYGRIAYEKIDDLFSKRANTDNNTGTLEVVPTDIACSMKSVSFTYPDDTKSNALDHLSLEIKRGEKIGICGSSGCGKSTLIKLLNRSYDADNGSIEMYGNDIKEYSIDSLRTTVGVVSQNIDILSATILENVILGNTEKSFDEVVEACKRAKIHDFIMSLPNGYKTNVGNRGIKLSGGQKQRIAIARVLLNNPDIIIFDEATSALDNSSERYIKQQIESITDKTVICIAHRLTTIMNMDKIVVMDKGHIIEQGKHQELLELNGVYTQLYKDSIA